MAKSNSVRVLKYSECTYCGQQGGCLDHVIPMSNTQSGKRRNVNYNKQKTVPACAECNSLLSNLDLNTISDRARFLAERLAIRYRKELDSPNWSEEELEELEGAALKMVVHKQFIKYETIDRIRHCNTIANLNLMPEDVWKVVERGEKLI